MVTPEPRGRWPKSQRIRSRRQYQRVQSGPQRIVLPHFIILLRAQDSPAGLPARLGITASRKLGGAVMRNRSKRLVKEAFRATRELWPIGLDIVIVVRRLEPGTKLAAVIDEWRSAAWRIKSQCARVLAKPEDPAQHAYPLPAPRKEVVA